MAQSTSTLVITLLALLCGTAVALVARQIVHSIVSIPEEDRRYKDPPPLGFRLLWWPIQWCSYPLARIVSQEPTSKLAIRLRKAGLEFCISPPQFVAGRVLCALLVAGLAALTLFLLGLGPNGGFSKAGYCQAAGIGALFGLSLIHI